MIGCLQRCHIDVMTGYREAHSSVRLSKLNGRHLITSISQQLKQHIIQCSLDFHLPFVQVLKISTSMISGQEQYTAKSQMSETFNINPNRWRRRRRPLFGLILKVSLDESIFGWNGNSRPFLHKDYCPREWRLAFDCHKLQFELIHQIFNVLCVWNIISKDNRERSSCWLLGRHWDGTYCDDEAAIVTTFRFQCMS